MYSHLQKKKITACPSATWFLVSNKLIRCYTLAPSHKCRFVALNETILHTLLCIYIAIYLKYGDVEPRNMCHNVNQPTATFNAYENDGAYAVCIHPPVCTTCTVYRAFYSHCIGLLLLLLLLLLHHLPLQAHFDRHSHAYCSNSGRSNNLCGCCSCPGGRVLRGHR